MEPFKIILAEDHSVVRHGIRTFLERQPDMAIAGEAMNGKEVLDMLESGLEADVLLTDINMPEMDGLELIGSLKSKRPAMKVLILSMLESDKYVAKAFKAGAAAYLLKNVSPQELLFALRQVRTGGTYVCMEIAMRLVNRLTQAAELPRSVNVTDLELSERDKEVLRLIAEGYTNQEIADKLFAGKRTVEGYRQSLMYRTGSRNTAALIKFAIQNHLID